MLGIQLIRDGELPLSRQIYGTLRTRILEGRMKPGDALPSTRELAAQLGVSRNTVCEAYDMLLAEAFVESRQGAPTRVACGVQLDQIERGNVLREARTPGTKPFPQPIADFRTGLPDLRSFPMHQWLRLANSASESLTPEQWGYSGPEGFPSLREEIAAWLFRSRGMTVHPEDVFITAGATHALHLLAELLYTDPCGMIVEDPCHTGMLRTLKNKGFEIIPLPVDEHGLRTEFLEGVRAKAAYITPSHQFPLGGILPASRRADLIRYAKKNDAYLIEDDYDSEFRYIGPPVAPLHTMDPGRVLYVGTFSKILFPALRIGYVILPRELHERWRYLRIYADVQNPLFEQAALSEFLRSRRFDRHVRQMRKLYGQRRQALLRALQEEFGDAQRSWGDAAGLHMAVEFPCMHFDRNFLHRCRENGLHIQTVDYHCIRKGAHSNKLLLGYGHLTPLEIQSGIRLLGKIF
jgi:GntR family transcriptional regulator/MocR family aminotransferase